MRKLTNLHSRDHTSKAPLMLDRRKALKMFAAAAALPGGAAVAQPMAAMQKPPRLRPGDTVGLVQPAGFVADLAGPHTAIDTIRGMGLVPKIGQHVYDRHGYLAGTDESRASDVNAMYADPTVRAVFAARGGWGSARLLPYLNWEVISSNPKLLVGFSDITALHMAIAARGGFPTIHASNAGNTWGHMTLDTFRRLAFDAALPFYQSRLGADLSNAAAGSGRVETVRPGTATGRLMGGNLTVLSTLMGTPFLPSFDGSILFLEDVDEAVYSIDRMLTQLVLSGVLKRVAGVVFGRCARCGSAGASGGGFTLSDVLTRHLRPLGVPVFSGAMIGHIANQLSMPLGVRAELDADACTIRVLEPAVA
jgi:muramoyltetrapeptide carboxypeptidase